MIERRGERDCVVEGKAEKCEVKRRTDLLPPNDIIGRETGL